MTIFHEIMKIVVAFVNFVFFVNFQDFSGLGIEKISKHHEKGKIVPLSGVFSDILLILDQN